jgi:N utilization substance protein B
MKNPTGLRHKSREVALQALYAHGFSNSVDVSVVLDFCDVDKNELDFAKSLVTGSLSQRVENDLILETKSSNWKIDRMSPIDLAILRISIYELRLGETPVAVIINEAVELAKTFGDKDSYSFINGILDKISKSNYAKKE